MPPENAIILTTATKRFTARARARGTHEQRRSLFMGTGARAIPVRIIPARIFIRPRGRERALTWVLFPPAADTMGSCTCSYNNDTTMMKLMPSAALQGAKSESSRAADSYVYVTDSSASSVCVWAGGFARSRAFMAALAPIGQTICIRLALMKNRGN